MKKTVIIVAILGVVALTLGGIGLAYAQDGTDPTPETPFKVPGWGGHGHGFGGGMHGQRSGEGFMHDTMMEIFADALDLSVTELEERLEAGETMWQIAEAEGLSLEEMQEIMLTARQQALEQAIEDGLVPEDWAEKLEVDGGFGPGMRGGAGRGFGWGMHDRFGGEGFMHDTMMDVFADALDLSVIELEERLEAGETMWQIAEAEGLSAEELGELMSTARQEALEQAVEDGLIPEDRAEWMEENGFQHGFGGLGDCGGGFRHGRPGMGWNFESTP